MPGLSAQLQTFGFWGDLSAPAIPLNFSSRAGWRRALSDGKLENVQLMVAEDVKLQESDERAAIPITLARRTVFPAAMNAKTAWSNLLGGTDYLEELPAPFRSGNEPAVPGLSHTNGAPNMPSAYASNGPGGLIVPQNGGFVFRGYLYAPSQDQERPAFSIFWGNYQIQIASGQAEIARVSDTWTQTKETALYELLKITQASAEIDALRSEIYEDRERLELGRGEDDWYNRPFTIEVIPEPAGNVYIRSGGKLVTVPHSDIKKTRQPGVLWGAGPLAIRCEGGAYFWQVGYPQFATSGAIQLGHWVPSVDFILDDANINGLWDESLPGTSASVQSEGAGPDGSRKLETAVVLTSADEKYSPWFYGVQIYRDPGARDGGRFGMTPLFDSDVTPEATPWGEQRSPIMDVTINCEESLRRRQFTVDMYDVQGATLKNAAMGDAGYHYPALENQVARLLVNGAPVITNGIIKSAVAYSMSGAQTNQPRQFVTRPDSGIRCVIGDAWDILDEQLIDDDPVGDNLRLGAAIRMVLKGGGFTDAELAGVSANDGRILPGAAFGENWLIRPGEECYRGDYLRDLVHKWGMGWLLYIDQNGVWQFEAPSTAVVLEFTKDHAGPGTYTILRPLDMPRETSEFYNEYIVQGSDANGNPITDSFTLRGSIYEGSARFKTMIGRRRTKIYRDDAIKTRDDLVWVKRSLKEYFGHPPRYAHFESYWKSNIYPGQRVTYDGVLCRIKSITGGSTANNTMSFLLQELG